jgi:acetyl-CoA C-acetyltransferase
VLVGSGTATQHFDDPLAGADAIGLMRRAVEAAAADVGQAGPALLDRVDEVIVPEGLWANSVGDAGRHVLDGRAPQARSVLSRVGMLQQSLFTRAAGAIAGGAADVVLLAGGEAKWRALRADIAGVAAPTTDGVSSGRSDEILEPVGDIVHHTEIERGLVMPVYQYAVMESALRHRAGTPPAEHARAVAELVAAMSRVAAANPGAWTQQPMSAAEVLAAPLVTEPYTKPSCSQWNVDQAAAFLLTTVEHAEAVGVPSDRWVFPHAGAESNHMVALVERRDLHRSPAIAEVGRALATAIGHPLAEVELLEIYSCFPAAVQMQCAELGVPVAPGTAPTVTGGMHFGGGPFNSFTFQALARLVPLLREDPEAMALLTSISGLITKMGAGVWSARPPQQEFVTTDVSAAAGAATPVMPVDPDAEGTVTIAGYTVAHAKTGPVDAVVVADTGKGTRAVARTDDADVIAALQEGEWCGRAVSVRGATLLGPAG